MYANMTREETVRLHRILWNHVADIIESGILNDKKHVSTIKEAAFRKMIEQGELEKGIRNPTFDCFCCEYLFQTEGDFVPDPEICSKHCPIDWGSYDNYCMSSEYWLFLKFYRNEDFDTAAKIARRIANLPERK